MLSSLVVHISRPIRSHVSSGSSKLSKRPQSRSSSSTASLDAEELLSRRPSLKAKDRRTLEASELLPFADYNKARRNVFYPLKRLLKQHRMILLGPYATVTFESYDLMWMQVQEMAFVEGSQVEEEVEAYKPLVPNGNNLVVTVMFEIENPSRRTEILRSLGHVEDTLSMRIGHRIVVAATSVDGHNVERTSADGKTSAVHFLKFDLDEHQKKEFLKVVDSKVPGDENIELAFSHPGYAHSTRLSPQTLKEISNDLL